MITVVRGLSLLRLQGCWYVARALDAAGNTRAQLSQTYLGLPTGGLHDRAALLDSQALLEELSLVVEQDGTLRASPRLLQIRTFPMLDFVEHLLQLLLRESPPLWLTSFATRDEVVWEFIPQETQELLTGTFFDPTRRDAFLINIARKVDYDLLTQIGADGELAVVDACRAHLSSAGREDLAGHVVRVSESDDTLGYDVTSPDLTGRRHLLEVKTTRSPGDTIDFYLSRNEARVGAASPDWSVVVARQDPGPGGEARTYVIGWLTYGELGDVLPADPPVMSDLRGQWHTARVSVPTTRLRPGLPLA